MSTEPTTVEKLRRLPWLYAHHTSNTVFAFLTVLGSVFILFLDEVQLDKEQIGLVLALLPFCALIAPLIGPWIARVGLKRSYLICWTARKLVVALLITTPWVIHWYGQEAAFYFVGVIVLAFAIWRAVGETAYFPWMQEVVPNSIRGKYSAVNAVVTTLAGALTMIGASLVLRSSDGLPRLIWLFAVGVLFGLISVATVVMIPGGQPVAKDQAHTVRFGAMMQAVRDRQFLKYLVGHAVIFLGMHPLGVFLPLFMKERVGLAPEQVVLLEVAAMCAMALLAMPWGWAADRYGSKPVMVLTLVLFLGFPTSLWVMPRGTNLSMLAALGIMFLMGLVGVGWGIGSSRLLFNSLVPPAHRTAYMAIFYAWMGLFAGIGPLLGGWLLERGANIDAHWLGLPIDAYTPLMVAHIIALVTAVAIFSQIRVEGEMPTLSFAGMFFRGDPIGAVSALISYNVIGEETRRLTTTERLGRSRSPLNVDELIESLSDPSFNVRYEAIHSMARSRAHPRLTDTLIAILQGPEPDLSIAAAWALGRLGDRRAIAPLREQLTCDYPLLAARSARALAMLGDQESLYVLLARLRDELDTGIRCAYASALGALHSPAALHELLAFLREESSESIRQELALALSRIAGDEHEYVRLWRRARHDQSTALAQVMQSIRRKIAQAVPGRPDLTALAGRGGTAFADGDLQQGIVHLRDLIQHMSAHSLPESALQVLAEAQQRLNEFGSGRMEYLILSINVLNKALNKHTLNWITQM